MKEDQCCQLVVCVCATVYFELTTKSGEKSVDEIMAEMAGISIACTFWSSN